MTSSARLPHLSAKLQGFGTTIFAEMTRLAMAHKAVNLGQGFPDFEGPAVLVDEAMAALKAGRNQYVRSAGLPELCEAVAGHRRRFYDLQYDPETEVTVCTGATEAIFASLQALLDVGDEVVMFEPFYDSYRASIAMAGAIERVVTLESPDFTYAPEALERAITAKTRVLLLNTPHNPTGKVFNRRELEHLAQLCVEHDLVAITDEVYEHLVYDGAHIPLASLPGMRERTVMISSTGKTFSLTGWKVGFTCASPALTTAIRTAHQFITFCGNAPFQLAMAKALRSDSTYYSEFLADYRGRRDRLCRGLADVGFEVKVPEGTYFVCADIRPLGFVDDVDFCRRLPAEVGVAAIPNSSFYLNKDRGRHLVRFAFCKTDSVLDEGVARLKANIGKIRA